MKLECIAGPEQEPLTLADVKAYLRIDSDIEDVLLASLISAACEYCEEYQHRAYRTMTFRLTVATAEARTDIELPRSKHVEDTLNIFTRDASGETKKVDNYSLKRSDVCTYLRVEETLPARGELAIEYEIKGECGEREMMAMRLLVAYWYENRLAANSKNYSEPPFAVTALLNLGRVLL